MSSYGNCEVDFGIIGTYRELKSLVGSWVDAEIFISCNTNHEMIVELCTKRLLRYAKERGFIFGKLLYSTQVPPDIYALLHDLHA